MALTFLAVHAHPDDEASSTGGLFRLLANQRVRTVLVTCTRGEFGDAPGGIKPEEEGHDADDVAELRQEELDKAVEILGINRSVRLGYRDSGMMGWPQNEDPASFWSTPVNEAAERLALILMEERPRSSLPTTSTASMVTPTTSRRTASPCRRCRSSTTSPRCITTRFLTR